MSGDIAVASEAKSIAVDALVGEALGGKKIIAIRIDEEGTTYQTSHNHDLVLVDADKDQANFVCRVCSARIGFSLPERGEPAAVPDDLSEWAPPAEFMRWMDPCSI